MPRSAMSGPGRIVNYFRTAELPVAVLVLDLCRDAVTERTHRSRMAKARATTSPEPPAVPRKKAKKTKPPSTTAT